MRQLSEPTPIAFQWFPSSYSGWGVYGLNLLLNWSQRPDLAAGCTYKFDIRDLEIDPLERRLLDPAWRHSLKMVEDLAAHAGGSLKAPFPLLVGMSRDFVPAPAAHNVQLAGSPTIGIVFFEGSVISAAARERAKYCPLIVAGSTWNYEVLKAAGIGQAALVLQGVNPSLFHPAPKAGLLRNRFVVFSGGKLENRKGQDLVVRAFRIFAQRHSDALLLTAWNSPLPKLALTLNRMPGILPIGMGPDGRPDIPGWTFANGISPEQTLHLGPVPNARIARILREADAALFASRVEGGTNLAAMEAMACGLPTILSANTGHLDLIAGGNCLALRHQKPTNLDDAEGWNDSEVDEIVEALEMLYRDRAGAAAIGQRGAAELAQLTWSRQLDLLADTIRPVIA
jgi:glycosyltransferase involved in cell wall biosynthesis